MTGNQKANKKEEINQRKMQLVSMTRKKTTTKN